MSMDISTRYPRVDTEWILFPLIVDIISTHCGYIHNIVETSTILWICPWTFFWTYFQFLDTILPPMDTQTNSMSLMRNFKICLPKEKTRHRVRFQVGGSIWTLSGYLDIQWTFFWVDICPNWYPNELVNETWNFLEDTSKGDLEVLTVWYPRKYPWIWSKYPGMSMQLPFNAPNSRFSE